MQHNTLESQIVDYFRKSKIPGAYPEELPGYNTPGFQKALLQLETEGFLKLTIADDVMGAKPTIVVVEVTGHPSSR